MLVNIFIAVDWTQDVKWTQEFYLDDQLTTGFNVIRAISIMVDINHILITDEERDTKDRS